MIVAIVSVSVWSKKGRLQLLLGLSDRDVTINIMLPSPLYDAMANTVDLRSNILG